MPNIPGTSGFIQPGVFARDRVVSRSASIPGGLRIPVIMGEGLREETIVINAVGSGRDGVSGCNPDGDGGKGRFFKLNYAPIFKGRTELYLNNTLLFGVEQKISHTPFDSKYDYRIDVDTGCIELQGASIADQGGAKYSAASSNVGNGIIVDGTCGTTNLIDVIDPNAPGERWTVKVVGVIRDSNGNPIPGLTTFTATGSVSGQIRTPSGQPYLFSDSYYTSNLGAASGNLSPCDDGFIVATSAGFATGDAVANGGIDPTLTDLFEFSGDLTAQGQAVVGDVLCVDGYVGIEITDIEYDSGTNKTKLTLATNTLDASVNNETWEIRATDLFVDDPGIIHNPVTGIPATEGSFTSSVIGKVLQICSGVSQGLYRIDKLTSSRRLRVSKLDDSSVAFPNLVDDDSDGFGEIGLTFNIMQTNGVLLFSIKPGTIPFVIGDRFFIDVSSRVLKANDTLAAKYIAVSDINDPEYFSSAADLQTKHGSESVANALTLGASLAFENAAAGVFAVQTMPALPRRTQFTLVPEIDQNGVGGFYACGGGTCEPDDLKFIIERSITSLNSARPSGDSQVNFFIVRNGIETQFFPNKVPFYNSQLETETGQNNFISSPEFAYSYTVINTDRKVEGSGYNGSVQAAGSVFSTPEIDFDNDDIGKVIVIQGIESLGGIRYTESDDISNQLFGSINHGHELLIVDVLTDNSVVVESNDGMLEVIAVDSINAQFFIIDPADSTNVSAAVLFHKSLVDSGTLLDGDGIKISYIDESDADFFDPNWFNAFEAIEKIDAQIVVPLPRQNRGGIFQAAKLHVETMSSINIQKERMAIIGAQMGVTAPALLGQTLVAVEDIGILEGIQGDDAIEILDGNIEDLQNFELSVNFDSNRLIYMYPDQIVRAINGTNTFIDGFYMSAAVAGFFNRNQNVAVPLTNKSLIGFSILRDREFRPTILNALGAQGATVVQPIVGGGQVLAGRTTSHSGFVEDEEPSIMFIRDEVKKVLRNNLKSFVGTYETPNTSTIMSAKVKTVMAGMISKGLITDVRNIRVERDKVDPRQWNVYLRFAPAYPINYVFIDIEVGIV